MELQIPPTIYVDESNSTGENLLDPAQPVFTIGAICLDDDQATTLVNDVVHQLPKGHGEPKYSILARTRRGQESLLECLASLRSARPRFYVAHKRFMIAAKMVDLLIEPMAYDNGYNMYEDGAAVGLANLLHSVGPVLGDKLAYERMLAAFVKALRWSRRATVDELFTAIDEYCDTASAEWRDTLSLFQASRGQAEWLIERGADGRFRDGLDPAIPCLVVLTYDMGQRLGPFRLVHDRSKSVARHALTLLNLDQIPNPARPGETLSSLPAVTIEFADSQAIPQLQLADWIAGAGRQWATYLVEHSVDPFAARLGPFVNNWLVGGVWPDLDAITNPRTNSID